MDLKLSLSYQLDLTFQPFKFSSVKSFWSNSSIVHLTNHLMYGNGSFIKPFQWSVFIPIPNPTEIRRIFLIMKPKQINMWIWHDKPFDSLKSSFFKKHFAPHLPTIYFHSFKLFFIFAPIRKSFLSMKTSISLRFFPRTIHSS